MTVYYLNFLGSDTATLNNNLWRNENIRYVNTCACTYNNTITYVNNDALWCNLNQQYATGALFTHNCYYCASGDDVSITANTNNDALWYNLNVQYTEYLNGTNATFHTVRIVPTVFAPPPPLTPEQQALRAERERVARDAIEKRLFAQKQARHRARNLLREVLSAGQWEMFEKHGYFDVKVPVAKMSLSIQEKLCKFGNQRLTLKPEDVLDFRIETGISHNVYHMEPNGSQPPRKLASFCGQPRETMPDYDVMAQQKLLLDACPNDFLQIANRSQMGIPRALEAERLALQNLGAPDPRMAA